MTGHDADVLVIGGGPAGSATALHLARRGLDVLVFDRQSFPRDKPCGEGIMPHGVRMLAELGVLDRIPPAERNWFRGITYVAGASRAVGDFPMLEGGFDRGLGVRRIVLDQAMQEAARAAGVRFAEPEAVTGITFEGGLPVGVQTRSGGGDRTWRGRFVVGADGNRSQTRKRLGLDVTPSKRRRYGVRAHLRFSDPGRIGDTVEVYVTPRGEVYTTPVAPDVLLVALLLEQPSMDQFGGRLEEAWEAFLRDDPVLAARFGGGERISPVLAAGPLSSRSKRPICDGACLVGDAAGFIDPITGEGISIALTSARLAAEAIHHAFTVGDTRAEALVSYERERRRELLDFVVLTNGLLWLSRFPRLAEWVVGRIGRRPELFGKLLGINCGRYTLKDLRFRDVGQLLLPV